MNLPAEKYLLKDYYINNLSWNIEDSSWKAAHIINLLSSRSSPYFLVLFVYLLQDTQSLLKPLRISRQIQLGLSYKFAVLKKIIYQTKGDFINEAWY